MTEQLIYLEKQINIIETKRKHYTNNRRVFFSHPIKQNKTKRNGDKRNGKV